MIETRRFQFFEMEYPEAREHFAYLQPYLVSAAAQLSLLEFLKKSTVEVSMEKESQFFNLLSGPQYHLSQAYFNLSYPVFRKMLFIDFGRSHSGQALADDLKPFVSDENSRRKLEQLCEAWYQVSYAAAQEFFSSQGNLRRYFSRFATAWWNSASTTTSAHLAYVQEFSRSVQLAGKDVLEAACGFGRLSQAYREVKSLVRIDLSLDMMLEAISQPSSPGVYCCVADLTELPFAGERFDAITAMQVTMHLSDPFKALGLLGQALRKSGELWTDFTCTRRDLGDRTFFQESFFTRIYERQFVINQCLQQGYHLASEPLEIPEQHDHYWLLLHLKKCT